MKFSKGRPNNQLTGQHDQVRLKDALAERKRHDTETKRRRQAPSRLAVRAALFGRQ
jgi:hypothetical protein